MTLLRRLDVSAEHEIRGTILQGYASVFNTFANLGDHLEVIHERAFDAVLRTNDVVALWNHRADFPLGRVSAGNLKLSTDSQGLHYEVDLPDTSVARDIAELVEKKIVIGSSFGFVPGDDAWSIRARRRIRTHTDIARLVDVSPVTHPAYSATTVSVK